MRTTASWLPPGTALLLAMAQPAHAQAPRATITDPRDGYHYPVVAIGGLRWFAENLRYRTADSRCYENDEANCEDHGRLYRLDDAMKACPDGWRVPSEEDWRALERSLGMPEAEIARGGRPRRAGRTPPQVRRRHRLQRALLGLDRPPPGRQLPGDGPQRRLLGLDPWPARRGVRDGLAPRRRRESELDLAVTGQRFVLAIGALRS